MSSTDEDNYKKMFPHEYVEKLNVKLSLCFYGKATAENELLQISNLLSQYKSNSDDGVPFNFRRKLVNSDDLILGAPSRMSHLPKAEAILPAHTLIKPALGMLKSAIKFPHKDYANGAGVYGNINNLGLAYDGKNERLMYSGFRRMPSDYILVAAPNRHPSSEDSDHDFSVSSIVLDSHDKADEVQKRIAKHLEKIRRKKKKSSLLSLLKANGKSEVSDKQRKSSVYLKEVLSFDLEKPVNSRRDRESKYSVLHHIIKDINKLRRDTDDLNNNFPMEANEVGDQYFQKKQQNASTESQSGEEKKGKTKLEEFYETQSLFDHVRIDHNAPEMKKLLPNAKFKGDDQKKWWFYSQDDFTSLTQPNNEKDGPET